MYVQRLHLKRYTRKHARIATQNIFRSSGAFRAYREFRETRRKVQKWSRCTCQKCVGRKIKQSELDLKLQKMENISQFDRQK